MLAGRHVGRPKSWGRSDVFRKSRWDMTLMGSLPLSLLPHPLPPRPRNPNSWKISSVNHCLTTLLIALRWAEYRVGTFFSLFMWFGVYVSLLCWFQLSLRNSVFGLHNVWIQLAWNYGFIEPSFLASVTSPCVYVCRELARAEWKNHLFPVQIPPNDRHTTQTGSHYPADDIKTTAHSSASMRQHGNELFGKGRNDIERSLASSWGW